jgi:hypothetical protein
MAEPGTMTKKAASLPDTKEIDSKAVSAVEEARGLSVTTRPAYEHAGAFLIALKGIEREIDATFDPVIKSAYEAHRAAIAARDKHREPIREAEKIIKEKMGGFQKIEEKRLREEEVRLRELAKQEEEQDRLKAAQVLIEDGRADEALALLEGEVETPPIYMPETSAPKVKGIVTREVWKFRIADPSKVPCEYHTVDEAKIRTVVRATEGKIVIPGVEIYMEKEIAAGGRR